MVSYLVVFSEAFDRADWFLGAVVVGGVNRGGCERVLVPWPGGEVSHLHRAELEGTHGR